MVTKYLLWARNCSDSIDAKVNKMKDKWKLHPIVTFLNGQ